MKHDSPEHSPVPVEVAGNSTAFLSFEKSRGINISVDTENAISRLIIDRDVAYPERDENQHLSRLLLPEDDDKNARRLQLPSDFVTLPQILNDAIGDNKSDRSLEVARDAFGRVGRGLAYVAMYDNQIPKDLSYKNVIFSRDNYGFKLLPPIEFIPFTPRDSEQAKSHVVLSIAGSLREGANNTTQAGNVVGAFGPFIKNFDW